MPTQYILTWKTTDSDEVKTLPPFVVADEAQKALRNVKRRVKTVAESVVLETVEVNVPVEEPPVVTMPTWMTFRSVADMLNVRYQQVYQKMQQERIRCERRAPTEGKRVLWCANVEDVKGWMERRAMYFNHALVEVVE